MPDVAPMMMMFIELFLFVLLGQSVLPNSASHCFTGSAFLEGMACMILKMPSRSAACVLRRLPSGANITTGVQIVPHLELSSESRDRIRLMYCLTSALSVNTCTISVTEK